MAPQATGIPQIVAVVHYPKSSKLKITKNIRQHLGSQPGQALYIQENGELTLKTTSPGTAMATEKSSCTLSIEIANTLSLKPGDQIAFVQRPAKTLALKRIELLERDGQKARFVEIETEKQITCIVETNPMPTIQLANLQTRLADQHLKHPPIDFLAGRHSFQAWLARQIIGQEDKDDENLRKALIDERIAQQSANGSWGEHIFLTARNLCELANLGLTAPDKNVESAANWLLTRPESLYNPGMFFGTDDLVTEQAQIIDQRRSGEKARFRKIKASEQSRVRASDDLIQNPCGPRIMWPNALVLEALLQLGYETHPRLQAAIRFITTTHDWCECGYQHGDPNQIFTALTDEQVSTFEEICVNQYRYGGLKRLNDALEFPRVSQTAILDGFEYELGMPAHIQGCEFITTRALAHIQDPIAKSFARAHLWRFAGIQRGPLGEFPIERHGTGFSQAGILEAFARYNLPIAKLVILNAIPWIVATQNKDGSWGKDKHCEATTLALLRSILAIHEYLPKNFISGVV